MKKTLKSIVTLSCALLMVGGCSKAKEQLGLTRTAPDEFAVVKRAPLSMPPDYTLRPPRPGAARPQEGQIDAEARAVVFGSEQASRSKPTSTESYLLQQTGGELADPSIRDQVDYETNILEPEEEPVAERLLGWTFGDDDQPAARVVDAKAEAQRLQKNVDEGKPLTEGETPTKTE